MNLAAYIAKLNSLYQSGHATEHSFRGDLQQVLTHILPHIAVINEPKRQACGAPDYILMTKDTDIPLGYIEAKDIGVNLKDKKFQEQFNRYKSALQNLIITDYLTFEFYFEGTLTNTLQLGVIKDHQIIPNLSDFNQFILLIKDFTEKTTQTLNNPENLAHMMANKAKMLANIIHGVLVIDVNDKNQESDLIAIFKTFQAFLIHDLDFEGFADIYAQTIAYGMFAARYHDQTLNHFSRQEAADLIPHSNPFLRKLFGYIAGIDLDSRIVWVVEELVKIFQATDVKSVMANFGKSTRMQDPIIHFYETFLAEYDPSLRKSRGVWYTPKPVVSFIVRAVDQILKSEFAITDGLADTQKIIIQQVAEGTTVRKGQNKGQAIISDKEIHRVQILDPATGTGTFLNEVVRHVYQNFEGMGGIWSQYVEQDLIPRLNGFELLMASYAMAHLKMDMLLTETGYTASNKNQRFRIFLTNSLEEHHADTGTIFANWLSTEANEANRIKRDTPVMVILGNPPYSGESANKSPWIMNLMEDYKKEPEGLMKLQERNPKWINDDYVKFMRYGQHYIERNQSGILAFINPHGFLDNPTFRGMRWHLLKTYDLIYVIDLHGNSKKKETCPDGSADINVFDIQQGVSINILVKTGKKKQNALGQVFHFDCYGKRESKYDFLNDHELDQIHFTRVENIAPNYFFVPKDFGAQKIYDLGFKVNELFTLNSVGIVTARDKFTIHESKKNVEDTITKFLSYDNENARNHFNLGKDVRDWQVGFARADLLNSGVNFDNRIIKISYRPFDTKFTYYTGKSKGFHCYPRNEVMQHFLDHENLGLSICKQFKSGETYQHIFISNKMIESSYVSNKTSEITGFFPLYLYPENNSNSKRIPNLNMDILKAIEISLGLTFTSEKEQNSKTFAPIDLLDYIYAVLHSPKYREMYKEFLKIDFPRVPYPENKTEFWRLVELGGELRQYHLMEHEGLKKPVCSYPQSGSNKITRKIVKTDFVISDPIHQTGKVWINDDQYFDHVPKCAWEFYIGGYQPAQKWLKDRKEKVLTLDDIKHYFKIIGALVKTGEIMNMIDGV